MIRVLKWQIVRLQILKDGIQEFGQGMQPVSLRKTTSFLRVCLKEIEAIEGSATDDSATTGSPRNGKVVPRQTTLAHFEIIFSERVATLGASVVFVRHVVPSTVWRP